MKKVVGIIVILAIAFHFSSCKKVIEDLLTFNIDYSCSFTVPSAIGINTPFNVPTPPVQTNATQKFQNNGTSKDKVKNIVLKKLTLTITNPSQANFSMFKSIKLYISASGQPKKLLAESGEISTSAGKTLMLTPNSDNLDNYVKQDEFEVEAEVVMRKAPLYEIDFRADMTFQVTADPL